MKEVCEIFALQQKLRPLLDKKLIYRKEGSCMHHKVGKLVIEDDGNCCAPTMDQRYCFEGDGIFWMMDEEEMQQELSHFHLYEEGE